jgi:hypothetical protein
MPGWTWPGASLSPLGRGRVSTGTFGGDILRKIEARRLGRVLVSYTVGSRAAGWGVQRTHHLRTRKKANISAAFLRTFFPRLAAFKAPWALAGKSLPVSFRQSPGRSVFLKVYGLWFHRCEINFQVIRSAGGANPSPGDSSPIAEGDHAVIITDEGAKA